MIHRRNTPQWARTTNLRFRRPMQYGTYVHSVKSNERQVHFVKDSTVRLCGEWTAEAWSHGRFEIFTSGALLMLLNTLLDDYAIARGVRPSTVVYFRRCISQFSRFRPQPTVDDLCPDALNHFLSAKPGTPGYRRSLRRGLLALMWFAVERGLADPPRPRSVARIKQARTAVRTWSPDDVVKLRSCAACLPGEFRGSTVPRGKYFASMIAGAWYLGLSQVDLHNVRMADFVQRNLTVSRQKTGGFVKVGLPDDEWELCLELATHDPLWRPWRLWGSREIFARTFARIVRDAGLTGPWKTLRASAGTAYELAHPGFGHVFLGNTRDVFLKNYYDPRREPNQLPHAPDLPRPRIQW